MSDADKIQAERLRRAESNYKFWQAQTLRHGDKLALDAANNALRTLQNVRRGKPALIATIEINKIVKRGV